MRRAINTRVFGPQVDPAEAARRCAEVGFEGMELTIEPEVPLTSGTDEKTCRRLRQDIRDAGVRVTSLTMRDHREASYGSPVEAERERARAMTLAMLDRAMWLGAGAIVVVPAIVGEWNAPRPKTTYAEALHRTYESLRDLVYEAEARGVSIAIRNVNLLARFLLSPVETADLIDRVNSPWLGVCLDTGCAMSTGYPDDWIRSLGPRIVCVHLSDYDLSRIGPDALCPPFDGDIDWPAVMEALVEVGYDGPLVWDGPLPRDGLLTPDGPLTRDDQLAHDGEPNAAEIKQRLDRLLAMVETP